MLKAKASDYFFTYKFEQILIHMNTKIGLLTLVRNWFPWEFQQIVVRPDFQKLHRHVYQKLEHLFDIQFIVLVRTIRIAVSNNMYMNLVSALSRKESSILCSNTVKI